MLTSRSEYRLLLRQDNADERLTPLGYKIGLISDERYQRFLDKQQKIEQEIERMKTEKVSPTQEAKEILAKYNEPMDKGMKLAELIKRPNVDYSVLKELHTPTAELNLPEEIYEEAEIKIKYEGYIKRQNQQVESLDKLEKIKIPANINYDELTHISTETREKLAKVQPVTLAQAARIGGVKPADISVLMVLLNK